MLTLKLKQPIILFIFITLSCLLPVSLSADSGFKIFQTQQPAQNLIPTIAPLYAGQAKFTAKNNTLIVKAPESIINEIGQLLKEIDKPLHNLLIEVTSSLDVSENYQQDSIGGRIKVGNDAVISSRPANSNNPNATVTYGKNGSVIRTTHTRRSSTHDNPDNFKVRALEGSWAFIQTGKKVPYYSSDYPNIRGGRYYPPHTSVDLVDVTSGFEVYPTLNGERVTLKVRPQNSSMNRRNSDQINTRSVETMVSGHLGQWIYLGGASNQINDKSSGTLYSSKRYSDQDMNYRIKVTIID